MRVADRFLISLSLSLLHNLATSLDDFKPEMLQAGGSRLLLLTAKPDARCKPFHSAMSFALRPAVDLTRVVTGYYNWSVDYEDYTQHSASPGLC